MSEAEVSNFVLDKECKQAADRLFGDFIMVSRELIHYLNNDVKAAVLFGELYYECLHSVNKRKDGFILSSESNILKRTGLSKNEQRSSIKSLVDVGLIEVDYDRCNKRMIRIRFGKIMDIVDTLGLKSASELKSIREKKKEENIVEKTKINKNWSF